MNKNCNYESWLLKISFVDVHNIIDIKYSMFSPTINSTYRGTELLALYILLRWLGVAQFLHSVSDAQTIFFFYVY